MPENMKYRLSEIINLCNEQGLRVQQLDEDRVDVYLREDCILSFCNLIDENDTIVGFVGTPWHAHGVVQFMNGSDTYIECDELDIITGLVCGELLIFSRYLSFELIDRWIAHKDESLDVKYIEAGEELTICRLA